MAAKPKTKRPDPSGLLLHDPNLAIFVVQLALNGGNASAAARAVGWAPEKGRRIVAENPELRSAAKRAVSMTAESVAGAWRTMHARALHAVAQALEARDVRVRLRAARLVIERVEGRNPERPAEEAARVPRNDLLIRYAMERHFRERISLTQAIEHGKLHMDEVRHWGVAEGLIEPGDPVGDDWED